MDAEQRAAQLAAWDARFEADGTAARIREEVATWPPFTDAQRADIYALLHPGAMYAPDPGAGHAT